MQRVGISLTWPSDETADLHGFSPLLADVDGAVAEQFGVRRGRLGERLGGRVQRATFPSAPTGSRVKRHVYGGAEASSSFGHPLSQAETIRSVVEQGVVADHVGIDFFGIGEHHTDAFPMPAGDLALAAIAARTSRIHLGSAVTVLSSDDPVRVFQRYSTLNAISGGRAEVILGRGSSIESFPLFGYDLADYSGAICAVLTSCVLLDVRFLGERHPRGGPCASRPLPSSRCDPRRRLVFDRVHDTRIRSERLSISSDSSWGAWVRRCPTT